MTTMRDRHTVRRLFWAVAGLLLATSALSATDAPDASAVIGGAEATNPGWVVGILDTSASLPDFGPRVRLTCAGALVAADIVLTAGHCIQSSDFPNPLRTPDQIVVAASGESRASEMTDGVVFDVEAIVMHPFFDIDTLGVDLAVIQLTEPVPGAVTVGVESNASRPSPGSGLDFYGWGRLANAGDFPDVLQYGRFENIDSTNCLSGSDTDDLCVGGAANGATPRICGGDSGGAFVQDAKVQAVASYAPAVPGGLANCGATGQLDGAQPVAQHAAWFSAVTATRPIRQAPGVRGTSRIATSPPPTTPPPTTPPPTTPPPSGSCDFAPAPFGDIAGSFATCDIGAIFDLGITTGTSPTTYSPKDPVTREQMAAFLARTVRLFGATCTGRAGPFVDIAGSFAEADIACIHGLGITTGTSATTYSPKDPVTREQMAAFLGRTLRWVGVTSCDLSEPVRFADIAGSFAENFIQFLKCLEITTGTSPTTYSPQDPVTREQMAAFVARVWRLDQQRQTSSLQNAVVAWLATNNPGSLPFVGSCRSVTSNTSAYCMTGLDYTPGRARVGIGQPFSETDFELGLTSGPTGWSVSSAVAVGG